MAEPGKMPVQLISVEEVVRRADDLARQIRASDFRPDTIVAIARGGFMPARFLCDFLHVHKLLSLKVEHYTSGAREKQRAAVTVPLAGDVRGEQVLLVDDVNDSGDTLVAARPHLEGFEPAAVRTAVLHEKASTQCPANFHSQAVQEWRWILYPWAVIEDVGQFTREMDPPPTTATELRTRLQQDYGLELDATQLDRVIRYNDLPFSA
ncbi:MULTISPECIES: phosphoribosyltransferase [Thioalkalivibrio]|uniref:phosphoribosyltransferase n=1 Tax=Thioalkalivibrio TaxID=106633 RepID=UPI000368F9B0|nr:MULTISPECIES: phosphoribosyltransferase [Thioalkalivibrio]OOC49769.1 phosphoribosyltransferase [Thioalkalivibrio versutus]